MNKDIYDVMTKDEIVTWLRGHAMFVSSPPRMSEVLFNRWQVQSAKLAVKQRGHTEKLKTLGAKESGGYARAFNASTNL